MSITASGWFRALSFPAKMGTYEHIPYFGILAGLLMLVSLSVDTSGKDISLVPDLLTFNAYADGLEDETPDTEKPDNAPSEDSSSESSTSEPEGEVPANEIDGTAESDIDETASTDESGGTVLGTPYDWPEWLGDESAGYEASELAEIQKTLTAILFCITLCMSCAVVFLICKIVYPLFRG